MDRRSFLTLSAATLLVPGAALAFTEYTPGLIERELAAGKTVFVDFSATWCSTCAVQKRVINGLRAQNPAYDEAMSFVLVDWDNFGRQPVATSRRIPRRSTLLLLRGDEELGRIVAGTSSSQIQELMDRGL